VKVAKTYEENLIYTYATGQDANGNYAYLRDLMFTAIITRNEILEEGLGLTIEILNGLKRAIALITEGDDILKSEKLFDDFFKNELLSYSHLVGSSDDYLKTIRDRIIKILSKCDIYSEDMSFNKVQWKRMDKLRKDNDKKHKGLNFYEHANSNISSIITPRWKAKLKSPKGFLWHKAKSNPVVNYLNDITTFNVQAIVYAIVIVIGNLFVEYKTGWFNDWSFSYITVISFSLILTLLFYTIRNYTLFKNYNRQSKFPKILIYAIEVSIATLLFNNIANLLSAH